MKIICIDKSFEADYITLRSDSSVLRNNDNFYMPDFSKRMECTVGYYLRITRLAKCISSKFASRCYDAVGVAVAFTAQDVVERLCKRGLPCDTAYCFDKSIALSPDTIAPEAISEGRIKMLISGEQHSHDTTDGLRRLLDEALVRASEVLTLKTGDIVYVASSCPMPVAIGDSVEARLDDTEMLNFQIR